jgi:hypothetical protein
MPKVSFQNDIVPVFKPYQKQMIWRFDLTSYEQVRANAQTIYGRISSTDSPMPPPPFDPLTQTQISMFKLWMDEGYPP